MVHSPVRGLHRQLRSRGVARTLELHKIYPVVQDPDASQEGDLRVIDESGEDYLYSARRAKTGRTILINA